MKVLEETEDGESVVNIILGLELTDLNRAMLGLAILCYTHVRGGNFRNSKIQGFIRIFDGKRTEPVLQVFPRCRNSEGISTYFLWAGIGRLGIKPQGVQGLLQNANEVQVAFCGAFLAVDAGLLKPCYTAFSSVNCTFQDPDDAIRYLQSGFRGRSHCLGLSEKLLSFYIVLHDWLRGLVYDRRLFILRSSGFWLPYGLCPSNEVWL